LLLSLLFVPPPGGFNGLTGALSHYKQNKGVWRYLEGKSAIYLSAIYLSAIYLRVDLVDFWELEYRLEYRMYVRASVPTPEEGIKNEVYDA
jgi:hypothetical protein